MNIGRNGVRVNWRKGDDERGIDGQGERGKKGEMKTEMHLGEIGKKQANSCCHMNKEVVSS